MCGLFFLHARNMGCLNLARLWLSERRFRFVNIVSVTSFYYLQQRFVAFIKVMEQQR